ncbi:MAG: chemotaxis protein CheW [Nitrospiraceae bacterium]|nr:chemotaxis protein CheW [Nitrospiraceae bacterium]
MSVAEHNKTAASDGTGTVPYRLTEGGGDDLLQFVICRIGAEEFAVDVLSVQEINRIVEVTRVPKTPGYVEGVINLRGRIIPVLDLRKLFGLASVNQTSQTRIVVVSVQGRLVGLVVDSVEEVLRIPKNSIEPPPNVGTMAGAEFTQGVGRIEDRLLILVDLNRLLLNREAAV